MKRGICPENVQLVDRFSGKPGEVFAFRNFLLTILNDNRMCQKNTDLARLTKMVAVADALVPGQEFFFEDEDQARIFVVVSDPFGTRPNGERIPYWPPLVMIQIIAFFEAVQKMTDVPTEATIKKAN